MKKYIILLKNSLIRNLAYRFRMLTWFTVNLILIFVFPFVWLAAYGDQDSIVDFNKASIVTYFIVLAAVNTMVVTHLDEVVNKEIKDGRITKNLVKPLSYFSERMAGAISYRVMTSLLLLPLVIPALIIFKDYLILPSSLLIWVFFFTSVVLAFILGVVLTYFIGLFSFWLDDASSLQGFYWISFALFSGQFAPLDFLPQIMQKIAEFLPFKYILYFSVNIYLEKITTMEIMQGLLIQLAWIALAGLICFITWKRGLKSYTAVGL